LGPLIPSIKSCLLHRHPYVRKNAALTVFHAHRLFGEDLIPDGPELMQEFINTETDIAARRNAFLMMFNEAEDLAIQYLAQNIDSVSTFGDGFALLVLELTRRVCRRDPTQKSRFVRVLFQMLSSDSPAVSYEAAWTLVSLSSSPTAVRAAAVTYTTLLNGQNDNNVKLIVLERLEDLKKKHTKILQELLMDILRALSSPNPDICKKVLDVAMEVVTSRNVKDVVGILKREVQKTTSEIDNSVEAKGTVYRSMLIQAIHGCAVRFPDVAESVVHTLMEFISTDGDLQVVVFVRAIVEQYPLLRPSLITKLLNSIDGVQTNQVMCICLWILGEYCEDTDSLSEAFSTITEQLGAPPFIINAEEKAAQEKAAIAAAEAPKLISKNVILSDGTYATQTVYSETKVTKTDNTPFLRKMIVGGDVFLGALVASCLTKLCLRAEGLLDAVTVKKMSVDSLLIMCAIVKMAEVTVSAQRSSLADCQERITMCCRALLDPKAKGLLKKTFLNNGKTTFAAFLQTLKDKELEEAKKNKEESPATQADDLIHFRQLRSMAVQGGDVDLDDGSDLARATGYNDAGSVLSTELSHVYQLSGFADPVYAEAFVTVHEYDIVLEILLINRTPNTLANLTVELSTMGDLKIVERPQSHTLGPLDQLTIRASIKVSSTETGHIFGTIVYDDTATMEKGYINLNDIHMDIMDYIRPAVCTDEAFRAFWAEFEWENKVAIQTQITDLHEFLDHIIQSTNMTCLTPQNKSDQGSFLAANLYARRYVASNRHVV
jgi:coatomer subunit beta